MLQQFLNVHEGLTLPLYLVVHVMVLQARPGGGGTASGRGTVDGAQHMLTCDRGTVEAQRMQTHEDAAQFMAQLAAQHMSTHETRGTAVTHN